MDRTGETTIARFLSRIQRIRLALRDGDVECKDLERKIKRGKIALEKQLLEEKRAVETEQKYKLAFAKVKLRLEDEKAKEADAQLQLREIRAEYNKMLHDDAALRRHNQQAQLRERTVQKKLTETERSLRENRTRFDRLRLEAHTKKEKFDRSNEEVAKLSTTLAQLKTDIAALQNFVSTKM